VKRSGVGCPDRAARGGKAGAVRIAVVDHAGRFVARVDAQNAADLERAGRGRIRAGTLHLAAPVPVPTRGLRGVEWARRMNGDTKVRSGLRHFDRPALLWQPPDGTRPA
jgi:hypothetical protein